VSGRERRGSRAGAERASGGFLNRLRATKADVLDVVQRLIEEVGNVRVVQCVDDTSAASLADDEPQMAEQAQLVRDRRGLHADRLGESVHRARSLAQASEDADATWCRQRLHRLGDLLGRPRVHRRASRAPINAVGHSEMIAEALFSYSGEESGVRS